MDDEGTDAVLPRVLLHRGDHLGHHGQDPCEDLRPRFGPLHPDRHVAVRPTVEGPHVTGDRGGPGIHLDVTGTDLADPTPHEWDHPAPLQQRCGRLTGPPERGDRHHPGQRRDLRLPPPGQRLRLREALHVQR